MAVKPPGQSQDHRSGKDSARIRRLKIADQDKTIKGYLADLDDLRQRLTLSEAALKDAEDKFNALAAERDKLVVERDQLKASLDKWTAAVAARDAALKQANEQLKSITDQRNDAVSKFNDLANKYNSIVKELDKRGRNDDRSIADVLGD